MSYGREIAIDMMIEEEVNYQIRMNYMNQGIWVSKTQKLKIKEMETSHIENCIRYLRQYKHDDAACQYIELFEQELQRREGAKSYE